MTKVLMVDDEEEICKVVKRILARHGYKVFSAADGLSAFSLIQKENRMSFSWISFCRIWLRLSHSHT